MWQMNIAATLVSATGQATGECTLDPNAMAATGGSLVVESRRTEPSLQYIVHWVGLQPSAKTGGCGSDVDVMVSRTDLQRLANAAGGFGVGDKGITQ